MMELEKKKDWKKRVIEERKEAAYLPMTLDNIKYALYKSKGNVYYAAAKLGTTRSILWKKISNTPSLRVFLDDMKQERLDIAEHKLMEQIEMGNMSAISLLLRTQGKDRGYTERATIEHELGENAARNSAALIEAMRRGSEDDKAVDGEYKWLEAKLLEDSQDQTK